MSNKPAWTCVRQRAGPLVKECRSVRPRLSPEDTPYDRTEKNKILRPPGDSSVCRSRVDRLELRLALFGSEGRVYTLTFDDAHLPDRFDDVRAVWKRFRYRLQKIRPCFDYAYLIEGRHGDHRYHLHLVLRDSDFDPVQIRAAWIYGEVQNVESLLKHPRDTYRRTARYWNKEQTDGVVIPMSKRQWVVSMSLSRQLPQTEYFRSDSGWIPIPSECAISGTYSTSNEFGQYRYAWYIKRN